ncbi:8610_t:CDS:2 [Diversispora eburnea]|uniref:8610_t:CDS:1 n=1 Tax=Diversispora eburnea TaxID=1213867 RepID=A0A9N8WAN2_9GLOM|nr:8610_t:CDS:2 [Diversispora eburnea]
MENLDSWRFVEALGRLGSFESEEKKENQKWGNGHLYIYF